MSLLFETICIKEGTIRHLSYHNDRLNHSRKLLLNRSEKIELGDHISIPAIFKKGLVKCRVSYGEKITNISYAIYHPRAIASIKAIIDNDIVYPYKYENRSRLKNHYNNRKQHDEILIIKNGLATDCTYYNVAFWNGENWLTPNTPLLPGTARARLLDLGIIKEVEIKSSQIKDFEKIALFNALNDFGELELNVDKIIY